MMPAYMDDGCNNVERLLANMDFAQVNGAVVTQEYIDGNQDEYLLECKAKYPDRIRICSLYEENDNYRVDGFDGIKSCAGRLTKIKLGELSDLFGKAYEKDMFISIDMADGDAQVDAGKCRLFHFIAGRVCKYFVERQFFGKKSSGIMR